MAAKSPRSSSSANSMGILMNTNVCPVRRKCVPAEVIVKTGHAHSMRRKMEKILKILKRIKHQCQQHETCDNCIMARDGACGVAEMAGELADIIIDSPAHWDIEKIERILS